MTLRPLPLAAWSFWRERSTTDTAPRRAFLTLLLLAWATLAVAGWAEVVYRLWYRCEILAQSGAGGVGSSAR
ncbi:MAG: hypothetical protein HY028_09725 [Gammaproteobacteria bacterium]|nr:hypothetical protein [Gammaproteobacteria bacterium]